MKISITIDVNPGKTNWRHRVILIGQFIRENRCIFRESINFIAAKCALESLLKVNLATKYMSLYKFRAHRVCQNNPALDSRFIWNSLACVYDFFHIKIYAVGKIGADL